jgi:hypothetical protein
MMASMMTQTASHTVASFAAESPAAPMVMRIKLKTYSAAH